MIVTEFLREHNVNYDLLTHPQTFDAQHLAQSLHVPGREVAKTVLLKGNGGFKYFLAVLPATHRIDFEEMQRALGGVHLELAHEEELMNFCPDCEVGAVPPFGSRYGMQTVVDQSLQDNEYIVFEGNRHDEAVRMRYEDYYHLERPMVVDFARATA